MKNNPIGIFDSGVGGLSIWREIISLLPNENTIYLADSKNAPYGQKSKEEILSLSIKNTEFLLNEGAKLIVVACNTATTNAIDYLRKKYTIPFIGIEPAIKPAALQSETKKIGILATKGTLNSTLFTKKVLRFGNTEIVEQIGEGLVPLIEEGNLESPELYFLLQEYLNNLLQKNIDHLVLGCSHYPFLIPTIKKIIGDKIKIIDSGEAVARQTKYILQKNGLQNLKKNKTEHLLYSNKDASILKNFIPDLPNITIKKMSF